MQSVEFRSWETRGTPRTGRDRVLYTLRGFAGNAKSEKDIQIGSMLAKLGLCAAVCALVLAVNGRNDMAIRTANAEDTEQTEETEETPGRLHFVEMPGILSVFAPEEARAAPLACSAYALLEENTLLCLVSSQQQMIVTPEGGTVKEIGEDADYGTYVCLRAEKDREWVCYGFSAVAVEEGQPLQAQDALGSAARGDKIYLRLRDKGRPADLRTQFDLEGIL